jgi:hypothetical protein
VSKREKQDNQKQQKYTCGVSKGAKQVYPVYSHHIYVIVVFGGPVYGKTG